ncbi:hypothetical protein PhCBS80983_g05189 [Powellomyces hirtus]|uniref:D-isomer specific 2-hydroxyacid dehydrogenase NAD-binding domain-containing protein n=1 Tax=Powellomyces hirtus TaxID=109895 RepID=A0A507DV44_9FUNG|nr:hypothetical protein PhCBS80983_g05189 [Powellomyces hirtus]
MTTGEEFAGTLLLMVPRVLNDEWMEAFRTVLPKATIYSFAHDQGKYDVKDVEILVLTKPAPGDIAKLPHLKLIVSLSRGVDPLLKDATWDRSIPVVRLLDPSATMSMVESCLAHVLVAHRFHNDYRRQQQSATWKKIPHVVARNRRISVLGLGDLGLACANELARFDFDVAGWARSDRPRPSADPRIQMFHGPDGFHTILRRSDILVILLPLTPDTQNLLNKATLSLLPATATVINLGRGPVIVEQDLLELLDDGHISHAALDVFCVEPLPKENPFWQHPRVTVIPHMGADGDPLTQASHIHDHLCRLAAGETLLNLVDTKTGY